MNAASLIPSIVVTVVFLSTGCSRSGEAPTKLFVDAEAREKSGDVAGALELYEEALKGTPNDPMLHIHIAQAAYKLKNAERGIQAIDRLMAIDFLSRDTGALLRLKGQFEAMSRSGVMPTASASSAQLTGAERRKYDAINLIIEEADAAKNSSDRRRLLYDLLEKSGELLTTRHDLVYVWAVQASAAVGVGEHLLARVAGQKLIELRADQYADGRIQQTLALLERNNLLSNTTLFNYPAELKEKLKAAKNGSQSSQFDLAYSLREDWLEDSALWYRKAADQGLAAAQNNLGLRYTNGKGVPKDASEAVRWYRRAAEQDHAMAQYKLGMCYDLGEGVSKDVAEATRWYRKAADQGNAQAQFSLGLCYAKGEGVSKDFAEAVNWYRKAADQGYERAQNNLGLCHERGEGVSKNAIEAVRWYRKAAEQGCAPAQFNLGDCYANGEGVRKDADEAFRWYRKAADQGHEEALKVIRTSSHKY